MIRSVPVFALFFLVSGVIAAQDAGQEPSCAANSAGTCSEVEEVLLQHASTRKVAKLKKEVEEDEDEEDEDDENDEDLQLIQEQDGETLLARGGGFVMVPKAFENPNARCKGKPAKVGGKRWANLGKKITKDACQQACMKEAACNFAVLNQKNGACTAFDSCSEPKICIFEKGKKKGHEKPFLVFEKSEDIPVPEELEEASKEEGEGDEEEDGDEGEEDEGEEDEDGEEEEGEEEDDNEGEEEEEDEPEMQVRLLQEGGAHEHEEEEEDESENEGEDAEEEEEEEGEDEGEEEDDGDEEDEEDEGEDGQQSA